MLTTGDVLSATTTEGMYGTLTVNDDGSWSYALDHADEAVVALNVGDTVEDTMTVTIADDNGGSTDVTVTITVTGSNDDPTISVMDGVVPNPEMTPANAEIDENMGGIPVGEVTIMDPDSGQLASADARRMRRPSSKTLLLTIRDSVSRPMPLVDSGCFSTMKWVLTTRTRPRSMSP